MKSRSWTILLAVSMLFSACSGINLARSEQLTLLITPALLSVPSDGELHPAFYVTVLDSKGRPFILSSPINVTIASSDERILSVQDKVTISSGAYNVIVNASSDVPEKKTVEVSASASGFQSSKIIMTTEPPAGTPKSLKVTLLPDILIPSSGAYAGVVVTIVDAYGKPARARTDLTVTLSSSNIQIADVSAKSIKIPKGSFSAKSKVSSKGFIGNAIVTASTSDLKTDSATLKVLGAKPEKLYIWFPSSMLGNETGYVFVGVVDKDQKPAKGPTPVKINFYSSDTTILSIEDSLTLGVEEWCSMVEITSSSLGTVTIYAMADGLVSMSTTINVVEQLDEPNNLKIYSLASAFPADEKSCTALMVQVVDKSGNPSKVEDLSEISIFSSYPDIFEVSDSVDIPSESSMGYAWGKPKLPGSVKVSAASPNFVASETTVSVYAPTPSTVSIIVPPIPSDGEVEACLLISNSGMPAPSLLDVQALLSSSDTRVATVDGSIYINRRKYFTLFKVTGRSPGLFSLTASGSGIPSISVPMPVHEVRPSIFHVSYVKPLANTEFPLVVQVISSLGSPAVVDEAVTINLASSNTSSVYVPETVLIEAEKEEVLLSGRGLSSSMSHLTISSTGFNSLNLQISPDSFRAGIRILVGEKYRVGEEVTVKAEVTMEGSPVEGVSVSWKGAGLTHGSTLTDSNGLAENVLRIQGKENIIEATASIPGAGDAYTRKVVQGANMISLEVSSNIYVSIEGAGSYMEGSQVSLFAPPTVSMLSILGILGGKHNFKQWSGALNSTSNTATLVVGGDESTISVQAVYVDDYSGMLIPLLMIAGACAGAVVLSFFLRRRFGE